MAIFSCVPLATQSIRTIVKIHVSIINHENPFYRKFYANWSLFFRLPRARAHRNEFSTHASMKMQVFCTCARNPFLCARAREGQKNRLELAYLRIRRGSGRLRTFRPGCEQKTSVANKSPRLRTSTINIIIFLTHWHAHPNGSIRISNLKRLTSARKRRNN